MRRMRREEGKEDVSVIGLILAIAAGMFMQGIKFVREKKHHGPRRVKKG